MVREKGEGERGTKRQGGKERGWEGNGEGGRGGWWKKRDKEGGRARQKGGSDGRRERMLAISHLHTGAGIESGHLQTVSVPSSDWVSDSE